MFFNTVQNASKEEPTSIASSGLYNNHSHSQIWQCLVRYTVEYAVEYTVEYTVKYTVEYP